MGGSRHTHSQPDHATSLAVRMLRRNMIDRCQLEDTLQSVGRRCTASVRRMVRCIGARQQRRRRQENNPMECTIQWLPASGMAFVAETGSGHLLTMDGAPDGGGRNLAPRPMEVVLAGTGGCTAYDVVVILRKSGQDIRGCDLSLKSERAEKDPKVFTKVHFHFTVRGRNLKPNLVERAIKLSHEKYCSASIMMEKTAELTHSFEIVDDAADLPATV